MKVVVDVCVFVLLAVVMIQAKNIKKRIHYILRKNLSTREDYINIREIIGLIKAKNYSEMDLVYLRKKH